MVALRARPHRQGRGRRQRIGLRPHHRGAQPHQRRWRTTSPSTPASATFTSTAIRSAPSRASQPFGGEGLSGTGPRPAAPTTSPGLPPSASARPTLPPPAATSACYQGHARSRLEQASLLARLPPTRPLRPCRQRSMLGYPFLLEATAAGPMSPNQKSPANQKSAGNKPPCSAAG